LCICCVYIPVHVRLLLWVDFHTKNGTCDIKIESFVLIKAVVLRIELCTTRGMYKLSGCYSAYCLREKSIIGFYSSLDNTFNLEKLATFIFRVSEVQMSAA
jgi:hypothetical protein